MERIVYSSRACAGFSPHDFSDLATRAAHFNDACGITGLLLYDGVRFLQAIEGERDCLGECYARITADLRHHDIVEIQRGPIVSRQFGTWSLRGRDLQYRQQNYIVEVEEDVRFVCDPVLQATFIGFAALSRPARY